MLNRFSEPIILCLMKLDKSICCCRIVFEFKVFVFYFKTFFAKQNVINL